ncbi:MAG: hypothetical protein IT424_08810 [Pirellulales bacterium]|nr:hypothetical protein [Pirellulales bacterium]
MIHWRLRPLLAVVLGWGMAASLFAQTSSTDSPLIGHFRFLPRYSVLHEQGGFAGRSTDFRVFGEFDLVDGNRLPQADGFVAFRNVNAWASHPILAYVLNLDNTLGLSRLYGEQLPVIGPLDLYRFRGKSGDGSRVDLYAAAWGPWLRLHGATTPPPEGADYFVYRLDALAHRTPLADFNGDYVVDQSDLAAIEAEWGEQLGANGFKLGDATGDGSVDGYDFLTWQQQVGTLAPPTAVLDEAIRLATAAADASLAAVPEPAGASLWAAAVLLGGWARRARLQRSGAPAIEHNGVR